MTLRCRQFTHTRAHQITLGIQKRHLVYCIPNDNIIYILLYIIYTFIIICYTRTLNNNYLQILYQLYLEHRPTLFSFRRLPNTFLSVSAA